MPKLSYKQQTTPKVCSWKAQCRAKTIPLRGINWLNLSSLKYIFIHLFFIPFFYFLPSLKNGQHRKRYVFKNPQAVLIKGTSQSANVSTAGW